MARSRNIKPGFFTNDELGECAPLARLLFAGLWTIADREGRLEYRPKRIKAEILPYDDCDVADLLESLNRKGFIRIYEVAGAQYIQINNWKKHQNPHVKESASFIPEPDEHHTSTVQEPEQHGTSPADSLNLIPDSFNRIPSTTTTTNTNVNADSNNAKCSCGDDHIISLYQQEIMPITAMIAESLHDDEVRFGAEWVAQAIKIASKQGKHSYSYIHGILERWWSDGFKIQDRPWTHKKQSRGHPQNDGLQAVLRIATGGGGNGVQRDVTTIDVDRGSIP